MKILPYEKQEPTRHPMYLLNDENYQELLEALPFLKTIITEQTKTTGKTPEALAMELAEKIWDLEGQTREGPPNQNAIPPHLKAPVTSIQRRIHKIAENTGMAPTEIIRNLHVMFLEENKVAPNTETQH
jgi:hypothetical protein